MCTQRNVTSLLATEPKQSISQIRFAAEFRRHDANQHSPFVFGFVRNCLKCFTNSWFVTLPPFAIIYLRISAMDKSLGAAMFTITNVFVRRGMTHAVVAALWLAALLSTNLMLRTWIAFCFSTLVRSFVRLDFRTWRLFSSVLCEQTFGRSVHSFGWEIEWIRFSMKCIEIERKIFFVFSGVPERWREKTKTLIHCQWKL